MKKALIFLVCLFPVFCSCQNGKKTFTYEAEEAAMENCSAEKAENRNASNDAVVGFIKKGSHISFGIRAQEEENGLLIEAKVSCPLLYKDDGSYPSAFLFSDIYLVTMNDETVETGSSILSPKANDVYKDNYYAFVTISFRVNLRRGDNLLSFSCVSSSNEATSRYASNGNFDCLTLFCHQKLSFYKPEIQSPNHQSYSFRPEKNVFYKEKAILVSARCRTGHEKDWIALLPFQDYTKQPVSSFYLTEEENQYDLNPNSSIPKGSYSICFFKDDSYELMEEYPIFVCEKEEDRSLFTFRTENQSILVTSKAREGHPQDWISLFRMKDSLGKIGSLYYYYPSMNPGEIDITTNNRNTERTDMELHGSFKLCYCKDDSYEELLVLYFYLP